MLQKIFETNPVALARLLRDQWNEFLDDYASRRLVSGPGIRLNRIWGSGTVISSTARSGDGAAAKVAGYVNYFCVEATDWDQDGNITEVSITDGGNPNSTDCGLTDVGAVPRGTLQGTFSLGTYICMRLSAENDTYVHSFELHSASDLPSENQPVVILAEIVRSGNVKTVVQRWTGGKVYWRQRFVIGFGRGNN